MIEKLKKNMGTDGRDRGLGKKIIAVLFFGAICLVFVFMGETPGQMGPQGGGVIAKVNGTHISIGDLRNAVQQMERQFGGGANPSLRSFIQNQALENLINRELIYQKSRESGLLVSSAELRDFIVSVPLFQENGRFQPSRYENYLRGSRQAAGKFESEIEKDLSSQRLNTVLNLSLLPSQSEKKLITQAQSKKANLRYVSFTRESLRDSLVKKVKLTSAQIDGMADAAKKEYDKNIKDYTQSEEVKARHILVKFKKGDKASEAAAKKKIEQLSSQAKKDNFASLAKKNSEDLGSKEKGGDLGFFARGRMVPEFEKTAFAMAPGEISTPVKSQFGYHLILVEDKKEAKTRAFENVQKEITRKLMAAQKADEEVEALNKALSEGKTSDVFSFVKSSGLKWETTGEFNLFSATIPRIGSNETVMNEAFRLNSEQIFPAKIFFVDGKNYLLRYQSVKKEEGPIDVADAKDLSRDKSYDVLQRLRKSWSESSKIERNRLN